MVYAEGEDFDHPVVIAALERVGAVAQRGDALAGIHVVEPDTERLRAAVAAGYRLVGYASDMLLFAYQLETLAHQVADVRGLDPRR